MSMDHIGWIVAALSLFFTAYRWGVTRLDKRTEEEKAAIAKELRVEREQTEEWRRDMMTTAERRHQENKTAIDLINAHMTTILATVAGFQVWKDSHEKQCAERYADIKERFSRIMEAVDDVRDRLNHGD